MPLEPSNCVCGAEPCYCGFGEDLDPNYAGIHELLGLINPPVTNEYDALEAEYGAEEVERVSSYHFMGNRLTLAQMEVALASGFAPGDPEWAYLMAHAEEDDDDEDDDY